ncbi:hypothetical protein B0I72DRAFT_25089 [Yarrowia lipolytica]|uniref:Uncharacterized protein n=1 Tax=Yarrowia lipolytica TaxID=4952 RepID=A0A371C477_YARLL|nr:hypothetical protein B0I71DRAFT_44125 [Yarrowia lipolytica]RDW35660.1 hypothetical protein B0I72DRAFT_25089 [Yarrowia lipolytica]RDW40532.1 hypothetical protein B0I73DRAFT_22878 [Yarrowia lipolytica]RDW45949.1 hypothetical protein B0I74DRAFT_31875 [Yarrowia lipolytica]RDW52506.1 hypothetical protein B0I75DRAFT_31343 [Yarrowia lipolytica]
MATTVLADLAVLLHKISHEVDTAEINGKLKDVYSILEPTIAEFKRLGAKARLHDVPDALWKSLTQTITTIMTLCEQRGLEKERQMWASKWATFKQSYEKGKAALAEERRRCDNLKSEVDALRDQLKDLQTAGSNMSESRKLADEEHLARHMQHLSDANNDKIKAIAEIEKLKASEQIAELKFNMVSKERDEALNHVAKLQSQLVSKDEELTEVLGRVKSDATQTQMALSDAEAQLAQMDKEIQTMRSQLTSKENEVHDLQARLDHTLEQNTSIAKELEDTKDKAIQLQASLEDFSSRESQFQQFRRSPHDLNMAPLGHIQQLHPNMHSPSTGTPPSLLHSIQHTPPSHAFPMQHTPPPHLQANHHYQSTPPRHGSYHQSSPLHSAYHGTPPLHSSYYQSPSPNHVYNQAFSPCVGQGSPYGGQTSAHGYPNKGPPRPRTNGRDGTSRPQTAHSIANQQHQEPLEGYFTDQPSPFVDQPSQKHNRPVSKGVRWPDNLPDTPLMTMNRGDKCENKRPSTSHSDSAGIVEATPVKTKSSPSKENVSPAKPGTSPSKASPTKYGTLKRKLRGIRRPPYGYMTGTSGGTVTAEAALRLDHPIVSWEGPYFHSRSRFGPVPAFLDERLETMKQDLSPSLVALMWSESCRRALRRRPEGPGGVNIESLKPLQFEKTKMKLAGGLGDRMCLGSLTWPVQIHVN